MKNKEFYKLLNKNKSNFGFTLTELLVGMIMSTFVIGALGFGLMNVLRLTQKGSSETAARNETSRALDFISDEMRRAESIEVDKTASITGFTRLTKDDGAGGTVDIDPSLILNVPGVTNPIVYTVAPPQGTSPWKGPLVIYRWGPVLNSNGEYTSTFSNQALVDKVSDESQTATCDGSSVSYQGFFACVVDDDNDGNTEVAKDTNGDGSITADDDPVDTNGDGSITTADGFVDTNGDGSITTADSITDMNSDGVINLDDGADVDGKAITAQLYFTGGTTTADGSTSTYSADTKTVARARTAPNNRSAAFTSGIMSFRTLSPSFSCKSGVDWKMRTDFGESLADPSGLANWNHEDDRQPQPITITGNKLVISSIPRDVPNVGDCLNSRINNGRETTNPTDPRNYSGNGDLGEKEAWKDDADVVAISHVIDFGDPTTFNGDIKDTCDTNSACGGSVKVNDGDTDTMNTSVMMLKRGSIVPNYGGYDANDNGITETADGDQPSLGEFLESKGLAEPYSTDPDGNTIYKIISEQEAGKPQILGDNERIVAFEIGYEVSTADTTPSNTTSPGIDFQDNIFVVQSNKFKSEQFDAYTVP